MTTPKPRKSTSKQPASAASETAEVDALVAAISHPLAPGIAVLRKTILGVSPQVREGVKWNSPSFRTSEWFATVNVRKAELLLILHLGAKKRADLPELSIADPAGLLEWLGQDRAAIRFSDLSTLKKQQPALRAILRQWLPLVKGE